MNRRDLRGAWHGLRRLKGGNGRFFTRKQYQKAAISIETRSRAPFCPFLKTLFCVCFVSVRFLSMNSPIFSVSPTAAAPLQLTPALAPPRFPADLDASDVHCASRSAGSSCRPRRLGLERRGRLRGGARLRPLVKQMNRKFVPHFLPFLRKRRACRACNPATVEPARLDHYFDRSSPGMYYSCAVSSTQLLLLNHIVL